MNTYSAGDDDWDDDCPAVLPSAGTNNVTNEGHSLSTGRGFQSFNDYNDDIQNTGSNGLGSRYENEDRGGRGGGRGRGGRGGRGGGRGGRGGFREPREVYNTDGDYGSGDGDGERGERGRGRGRGGRGRGRGGRGGSGDFGDRNSADGKEEGELKKPPVTYIPPEPTDNEDEMFNNAISSGINFNKFDCIAVKVTGENAPAPLENFESGVLRKLVVQNILKSGYKKPTPIQKNAIPIILDGRDLMGCAQTGSGKTAAFLVPLINMLLTDPSEENTAGPCTQPQVVIMSPTRELAMQIFQEARKFAHGSPLKLSVAYGGTAVRYQSDNIARGCDILVATPGRLLDFVDRGRVSFASVRCVVLDEADRMLDLGFMPAIEKMMDHSTMVPPDKRQTLMFSATFPGEVQHVASRFLNNYLFVAVGIVGGASTDVEQVFHEVNKFEKQTLLKKLIKENHNKRVLVFVETKRNADYISSMLSELQMLTSSMHGNRDQSQREAALYNFKSGNHCILVATAVAARGLDIKNVDIVVNYDLPKSIDEYVHRIGRTGRVGNRGRAISFFDREKDAALIADLTKILREAEQSLPDFLKIDYTNTGDDNTYGGSDVRDFNNTRAAVNVAAEEPDEEW